MAESADIIREYLISVGVKANTQTLASIGKILGDVEGIVAGLTLKLAEGVLALETFVATVSHELEDLYWASKRLKSSASDIQDFELRMRKAGASAQDARESLETIAAFRRTNPAGDAFLGMLGVNTRGKGAVEVMDQLINRFKQLNQQGQYWLAVRWGERLGLSERQVFSMIQTQGRATKEVSVYAKAYQALGLNIDQATKAAHDYMNRLRDLRSNFVVLAQVIGVEFLPYAEKLVQWVTQGVLWIGKFSEKVAAFVNGAWRDLTNNATLNEIAQNLMTIGRAIAYIVSEIWKLGGNKAALAVWYTIRDVFKAIAHSVALITDLLTGRWGAAWNQAKNIYKDLTNDTAKEAGVDKTPAAKAVQGLSWGGVYNTILRVLQNEDRKLKGIISNDTGGLTKFGVSQKAHPGVDIKNLTLGQAATIYKKEYWDAIGADKLPEKIQFAALDAAVNQGVANAKKWLKESGGDLFKFDVLRAQHYRSLAAADPKKYGKYLEGWLSRIGDPAAVAESLNNTRLGAKTGGKNVVIQQHNTTTIHGAKDPNETARQVKRVSDRSNGDLVRNFATALA